MNVYIVLGVSDHVHNQVVKLEKVFDCRKKAKAYADYMEAKAKSRWFKVIGKEVQL